MDDFKEYVKKYREKYYDLTKKQKNLLTLDIKDKIRDSIDYIMDDLLNNKIMKEIENGVVEYTIVEWDKVITKIEDVLYESILEEINQLKIPKTR
jgi:hypothetical protein